MWLVNSILSMKFIIVFCLSALFVAILWTFIKQKVFVKLYGSMKSYFDEQGNVLAGDNDSSATPYVEFSGRKYERMPSFYEFCVINHLCGASKFHKFVYGSIARWKKFMKVKGTIYVVIFVVLLVALIFAIKSDYGFLLDEPL